MSLFSDRQKRYVAKPEQSGAAQDAGREKEMDARANDVVDRRFVRRPLPFPLPLLLLLLLPLPSFTSLAGDCGDSGE